MFNLVIFLKLFFFLFSVLILDVNKFLVYGRGSNGIINMKKFRLRGVNGRKYELNKIV